MHNVKRLLNVLSRDLKFIHQKCVKLVSALAAYYASCESLSDLTACVHSSFLMTVGVFLYKIQSTRTGYMFEYNFRALVVVIVYLVGGFLVMRFARGARGVEQIPNYEFWKECPLLIWVNIPIIVCL